MKKLLGAMLVAFVMVGSANAAIVTYELDTEYSGGVAPSSNPAPWLTATFDDGDTAGSVTLTLEANLAVGYVSELYFNIDPYAFLDIGTYDAGWSSFTRGTTTGDCCIAGGGYAFDAYLVMQNGFLTGNTVFQMEFLGDGITAAMFATTASPMSDANSPLYIAAHVQALDANDGSGWITGNPTTSSVPEPATLLMMGLGLLGLGFSRRSRKA